MLIYKQIRFQWWSVLFFLCIATQSFGGLFDRKPAKIQEYSCKFEFHGVIGSGASMMGIFTDTGTGKSVFAQPGTKVDACRVVVLTVSRKAIVLSQDGSKITLSPQGFAADSKKSKFSESRAFLPEGSYGSFDDGDEEEDSDEAEDERPHGSSPAIPRRDDSDKNYVEMGQRPISPKVPSDTKFETYLDDDSDDDY